ICTREQPLMHPVLMLNMDVKDSHEEAAAGAKLALDLCMQLEAAKSWEDEIDDIVRTFEKENNKSLLFNVSFY
ncbi:uncharacterized protein A4U43_C09F11740, partial [Asparagus officinalis]